MPKGKKILAIIVFAQFCCTSLWFAGNAVMNDLLKIFDLEFTALGHLTSAVQTGFIAGTLFFALFNLADRFSPSRVFFICAITGSLINLAMILETNTLETLLFIRFLTGVSLAGIYPVGMKIASDYYQKGLGTSLGFLVGALVIGTAFPHLLKELTGTGNFPWKLVVIFTSVLAGLGGALMLLLIPDGPYRQPMLKKDLSAFFQVFKLREFKAAALGYFGHMWELYAFWAFVPFLLNFYQQEHSLASINIPLMSFIIIGSGGIACVMGGYISRRLGTKRTAAVALATSGICCLLSPLFLLQDSQEILFLFLILWGLAVVADSPLFSTLVAKNAPEASRGTALTIVNSIGFAITILSIQLLNNLALHIPASLLFLFLAPGPVLGIVFLFHKRSPISFSRQRST